MTRKHLQFGHWAAITFMVVMASLGALDPAIAWQGSCNLTVCCAGCCSIPEDEGNCDGRDGCNCFGSCQLQFGDFWCGSADCECFDYDSGWEFTPDFPWNRSFPHEDSSVTLQLNAEGSVTLRQLGSALSHAFGWHVIVAETSTTHIPTGTYTGTLKELLRIATDHGAAVRIDSVRRLMTLGDAPVRPFGTDQRESTE